MCGPPNFIFYFLYTAKRDIYYISEENLNTCSHTYNNYHERRIKYELHT